MNIYKIYHKDEPENTYVGSTKHHIEVRKFQHFQDRNKKKARTAISFHMLSHNFEDYIVELLEQCNLENVKERELYWISVCGKMNEVNGRSNNPDYKKEYAKEYRKTHPRDPIKHNEHAKAYYLRHREKILATLASSEILCECGVRLRTQHLNRHLKSKNHIIRDPLLPSQLGELSEDVV